MISLIINTRFSALFFLPQIRSTKHLFAAASLSDYRIHCGLSVKVFTNAVVGKPSFSETNKMYSYFLTSLTVKIHTVQNSAMLPFTCISFTLSSWDLRNQEASKNASVLYQRVSIDGESGSNMPCISFYYHKADPSLLHNE